MYRIAKHYGKALRRAVRFSSRALPVALPIPALHHATPSSRVPTLPLGGGGAQRVVKLSNSRKPPICLLSLAPLALTLCFTPHVQVLAAVKASGPGKGVVRLPAERSAAIQAESTRSGHITLSTTVWEGIQALANGARAKL